MKAIHPWGIRVKSSPDKMKKRNATAKFQRIIRKYGFVHPANVTMLLKANVHPTNFIYVPD